MKQLTNFERLQEARLLIPSYQFTPAETDHINSLSQAVVDEMIANAEQILAGNGGPPPNDGFVF